MAIGAVKGHIVVETALQIDFRGLFAASYELFCKQNFLVPNKLHDADIHFPFEHVV